MGIQKSAKKTVKVFKDIGEITIEVGKSTYQILDSLVDTLPTLRTVVSQGFQTITIVFDETTSLLTWVSTLVLFFPLIFWFIALYYIFNILTGKPSKNEFLDKYIKI